MKVRVNIGCWRARQRVKEERWMDRLSTVRPSKKIQGRLYRNSKRLSQHDGEDEVRQDSIEGVGEIFDGWWDGVSAKVG